MLAIAVDGRVVGDVVAVGGARPTVYRVALGRLASGTHRVSIAQSAPILYGRDLPEIAGRFENNHTDASLLAYHAAATDDAGQTTIE